MSIMPGKKPEPTLEDRVRELEEKVKALEKRLKAMEDDGK